MEKNGSPFFFSDSYLFYTTGEQDDGQVWRVNVQNAADVSVLVGGLEKPNALAYSNTGN